MYSFNNDYSEGTNIQILDALRKANNIQSPGYGDDMYSKKAKELIKKEIGRRDADIHFIPGGTPCNILAIASALRPYEAVIACDSGHINVHETGAIEATGHKILATHNKNGKLTPAAIERICLKHTDEHMVHPKMVFISNATEFGTIYSLKELKEIKKVCVKYHLYFYLDGARLSNALAAKGNDVTLKDIARIVDMFYIGGTKNGALLGEAFVILNKDLKKGFRFNMKQRGFILAKTRIVPISFIELFKDNLYLKNASTANSCAQEIAKFLKSKKIKFFIDSPTNQIFPILPNNVIKALNKQYIFSIWDTYDSNKSVVRFVTSFNCTDKVVKEFKDYYNKHVK